MKSSREQFEEWASHSYGEDNLSFDDDSEEYECWLINDVWESWQASRSAMDQEEVTTAPFLKVD